MLPLNPNFFHMRVRLLVYETDMPLTHCISSLYLGRQNGGEVPHPINKLEVLSGSFCPKHWSFKCLWSEKCIAPGSKFKVQSLCRVGPPGHWQAYIQGKQLTQNWWQAISNIKRTQLQFKKQKTWLCSKQRTRAWNAFFWSGTGSL